MADLRVIALANTNIKPTLRQTADIAQVPELKERMSPFKRGEELSIIDCVPLGGHYFVVLSDPIGETRSGFLWKDSVEIYDADVPVKTYPVDWDINMDFAGRIVHYMMDKGYDIADGFRERNIVYIEGVNTDGVPNSNQLNHWNDLCCVISFENNTPVFVMAPVPATTEPGLFYTENPLNKGGAFRIAFGQHKAAWYVGTHGWDYHSALVQCGEIIGYRDLNKDGKREGDLSVVGTDFFVNQHATYSGDRVDRSSAGCLVRRYREDHDRFMWLLKRDPRYIRNQSFCFDTTVINGQDFNASQWGYQK